MQGEHDWCPKRRGQRNGAVISAPFPTFDLSTLGANGHRRLRDECLKKTRIPTLNALYSYGTNISN